MSSCASSCREPAAAEEGPAVAEEEPPAAEEEAPAAAEEVPAPVEEAPAAAEEEPPAKEGEPAVTKVPGKLKDTIFTAAAGEDGTRENGGAVLATPTSANSGGPKRHVGITLATPRGAEFEANEIDPSGTKGGAPLKFTPGQVRSLLLPEHSLDQSVLLFLTIDAAQMCQ